VPLHVAKRECEYKCCMSAKTMMGIFVVMTRVPHLVVLYLVMLLCRIVRAWRIVTMVKVPESVYNDGASILELSRRGDVSIGWEESYVATAE